MKSRKFGCLDWRVTEVGFGAWAIGGGWGAQRDADSQEALRRFIELGGNFIDTAQGYGNGRSERLIGAVLQERSTGPRVYVATKIPPAAGSWPPSPYDSMSECYGDGYLRERVERSLMALRTDCLDLVQLHTWTRAWNADPQPLLTLRRLQKEGKVRAVGLSSPEHDQNAVLGPMRAGLVDAVQVIYNVFEQEAQAEIFPTALARGTAVIVRVAFDESSLTGKLTADTRFPSDDFRNRYFAGDRLERTVARVAAIRAELGADEPDLAAAALKFALKPEAVAAVIPGIRTVRQAELNLAVSDQPPLDDALERRLRRHQWRRGDWYKGK